MSAICKPVEERRASRTDVDFHAQLKLQGMAASHVHLVNISPFGCMVRTRSELPQGQQVQLRLPGFAPVAGRVVWSKLDRAGIEFLGMIERRDYDALLPALNPLKGPAGFSLRSG